MNTSVFSVFCYSKSGSINWRRAYREGDSDDVGTCVVLHHRPLQLPARVGHVDPLPGQQRSHGRDAGEAGPDQLCLAELAHFPAVVEPHHVGGGRRLMAATAGHRFDALYDGRIEAAVNAGRHHPGAEDRPLGQPLAGGHDVVASTAVHTHAHKFSLASHHCQQQQQHLGSAGEKMDRPPPPAGFGRSLDSSLALAVSLSLRLSSSVFL